MSTATRFARYLAVTLALMVGGTASAQLPAESAAWKVRKEDAPIRISTLDMPNSDFDAFKAETVMDAPIRAVMAVLATPKSCTEWMHNCLYSEALPGGDFNKRYGYSINDLPWPVKDRDVALELTTTNDLQTGEIQVLMVAKEGLREEHPDYVRVHHSETLYILRPLTDDKTVVVWIQHTEPNGALPSWLVNALLIDIPYYSLRKFGELVKTPAYQDRDITFNDQGRIIGMHPRTQ